jgi:hypothetical protein
MDASCSGGGEMTGYQSKKLAARDKLEDDDDIQTYTRPWVGLTWEEIDECFKITPDQYLPAQIYKRIEAKLKEKNT